MALYGTGPGKFGPMLPADYITGETERKSKKWVHRRIAVIVAVTAVGLVMFGLNLLYTLQQSEGHHAIPVDLWLPSGPKIVQLDGRWPELATTLRLWTSIAGIVLYAVAIGSAFTDKMFIIPGESVDLRHYSVLFGALTAFVLTFFVSLVQLLMDASAYSGADRTVFHHNVEALYPLPHLYCCGVRMPPEFVSNILRTNNYCYQNRANQFIPQWCHLSGNSTSPKPKIITKTRDLLKLTCNEVFCSRSRFTPPIVIDSILMAWSIFLIAFYIYLPRSTERCEDCACVVPSGKMDQHKTRECPAHIVMTCVACNHTLRSFKEVEAHIKYCAEGQQRLLEREERANHPTVPEGSGGGGGDHQGRNYPASESNNPGSSSDIYPRNLPLQDQGDDKCCYCRKSLKSVNFNDHLTKHCTKYRVPCRYCSRSIVYMHRANHEDSCRRRGESCGFCGESIPPNQIEAHFSECLFVPRSRARPDVEYAPPTLPAGDRAVGGPSNYAPSPSVYQSKYDEGRRRLLYI